jgi:glycerophosphoryl diester phosphodiesterase
MWVIAHRGASWDERENSLAAFERAIAVGADYLELDVQMSLDGALVVFHDLELSRLTPLRGALRRRPLVELRVSIAAAAACGGASGSTTGASPASASPAHAGTDSSQRCDTVNDIGRMRELAALGVDGLFTDRPELARWALAAPPG